MPFQEAYNLIESVMICSAGIIFIMIATFTLKELIEEINKDNE